MCFVKPSLVYGIYIEATEINILLLHTHHFSCACVAVDLCMLFSLWCVGAACTRESSLLFQLTHQGRVCQSNPELTGRVLLASLLRGGSCQPEAGTTGRWPCSPNIFMVAGCLNSCPQAGALTTEASPQPILLLLNF